MSKHGRAPVALSLCLLTVAILLTTYLASPTPVSAGALDQTICESPAGLNGVWSPSLQSCTIPAGHTGNVTGTTIEVYEPQAIVVSAGATLNVSSVLYLYGTGLYLNGTVNVLSGGTISAHGTALASGGAMVTGILNINAGGQYLLNGSSLGGMLSVNPGGQVQNYGVIESFSPADLNINGGVYNHGTLTVRGAAEVVVIGTLDNLSGGSIFVYGSLVRMPSGTLTNRDGASIYLFKTAPGDVGRLSLSLGGEFTNAGYIETNSNTVFDSDTAVTNDGSVVNRGEWQTDGKTTNGTAGVFHNYGTVLVGARWENQGHVDGYGSWEFSVGNGILNNYGTMSFSGSVTLRQHYSLQNRIGATMSLNGSLDAVQGGGVLWNDGQLDLGSGANVSLDSFSVMMNQGICHQSGWVTTTAIIQNTGSYYLHCGAVIYRPAGPPLSFGAPLIDLCVGTIRIIKSTAGGDGVFDYTAAGGGITPAFFITATAGSGVRDLTGLTANRWYTITEALAPGWWLTGLTVTDPGGGSHTSLGDRQVYVDLSEGRTITCTFTNTKKGHLTVRKETLPDGDPTWFPFSAVGWGFNLGDGTSFTSEQAAGTYLVTETLVSGWMTPTITCSDTDSTGSGYFATYRIAVGEWVTCTFTNARRASLTVDKAVVPSPNPTLFRFDYPGMVMNIGESDVVTLNNLAPGTHRVTETVTSGWQLAGLSCSDANSYLSGTTAVYQLEPGEHVTCTFTNEQLSTITVLKATVPHGDPTLFQFTGALAGALSDGGSLTAEVLPGIAWVTETVKAGWTTMPIVCSDSDSGGNAPVAEFRLAPGEWVTCTFTNVMGPDLGIDKTVQPSVVAPRELLTYTLTYGNYGQQAANQVTIDDTFPGDLELLSWESSGHPITRTGASSLQWAVGTLGPGEGGIITLTARSRWACNPVTSTVANYVSMNASALSDPKWSNNSDSAAVTVKAHLPPQVAFTSTTATGCAPLTVYFTDTSTARSEPIAGWYWTFGDGSSSSAQNPVHTYGGSGHFNVSLQVTDTMGCAAGRGIEAYVTVRAVTAAFAVADPPHCAATAVAFTNQSTAQQDTLSDWLWAFGDGATSTDWSPTHSYLCPGVYTVTLSVWSSAGCSAVHRETVTISSCLEVSKTDRFDPVPATHRIEYSIVVRNTSAAMYDLVWITDTLPAGTYFLPYVPENAGWHDAGNRVVTRSVANLAGGASMTLQLMAGTHSTARGLVTNEVVARWGCVSARDTETTVIAPPVVEPTPVPTATPTPVPGGRTEVVQAGSGTDNLDTYIYRYQPGANYSLSPLLRVGYRRNFGALLRFDLAALPQGAVIDDARLELYAAGWSGADVTVGAYAISSTMMISETSWNQPLGGAWWSLGGANDVFVDRREAPEDELTTNGPLQWYRWELTDLVQQWVAGLPNNGVLLRQSVYDNASFHFASAEHGVPALRPRLVIHYH